MAYTAPRSLGTVANTLACPKDAFCDLDQRPSWLSALLVFASVSILLNIVLWPYADKATLMVLPPGVDPARVDEVLKQFAALRVVALLLTPLFVWLRISIIAGLLFIFLALITGTADFRKLLSVTAHAQLVLLFNSAITTSVVVVLGIDRIESPTDLTAGANLDLLVHADNAMLRSICQMIGPFDLWYIILLILGVATVGHCSKAKALVCVIGYWMVSAGFNVAMAGLAGS